MLENTVFVTPYFHCFGTNHYHCVNVAPHSHYHSCCHSSSPLPLSLSLTSIRCCHSSSTLPLSLTFLIFIFFLTSHYHCVVVAPDRHCHCCCHSSPPLPLSLSLTSIRRCHSSSPLPLSLTINTFIVLVLLTVVLMLVLTTIAMVAVKPHHHCHCRCHTLSLPLTLLIATTVVFVAPHFPCFGTPHYCCFDVAPHSHCLCQSR